MANPLALRSNEPVGGGTTLGDLHAYAARLNAKNFSIGQGLHWFVNKRQAPDGEVQHFLDNRKIYDGFDNAAPVTRRAAQSLRVPYDDR